MLMLSVISMPVNASAKSFYYDSCGIITASGTGTVEIKPDGSILHVSISIIKKSHKSAYINLVKTIADITSRFKNNKAVKSIKAVQINIAPNRNYNKGKWTIKGYNANENLIIKIYGNKSINNAVLYLLKYKSARLNRINPIVSNMEKYKIKAVKRAYKHAILKIKAVLKLIGVKSYVVKTVVIKSAVQRIPPIPVMMQADMTNVAKKVYFPGKDKIPAGVFVKVSYK